MIKNPKIVGLAMVFVVGFNIISLFLFRAIMSDVKKVYNLANPYHGFAGIGGLAYYLCWVTTVFSFVTGLSSMAIGLKCS